MGDWIYWIWFQMLFERGGRRVEEILGHYHHPQEIYHSTLNDLKHSGIFKATELDKIAALHIEETKTVISACEKAKCRIITPDHEEYPLRLRNIFSIPCALYVLGDIAGLDNRLAIAMVGTRRYSEYGKEVADRLSRALAAHHTVVVSGFAIGIDTVCHIGALKGGGPTIGVIGCGVDIDYPASNRELKKLMIQNGAIISEYPPGTLGRPEHFPVRNRIISGITSGTVVVEGAKESGSLITSAHALAQGKDVFAVPGSIFAPMSEGPNWLIRQGAIPVTQVSDILDEYKYDSYRRVDVKTHKTYEQAQLSLLEENNATGLTRLPLKTGANASQGPKQSQKPTPKVEAPPQKEQKRPPAPDFLNNNQLKVYELISINSITPDELQLKTSISIQEVLSALTQLEIYGLITAHPGRRFTLSN